MYWCSANGSASMEFAFIDHNADQGQVGKNMEFVVSADPAKPGFDQPSGLRATGGDRQLLRELAQLFLQEYPALIADLRSAVASRDPAAIAFSAHALKGCVGHFGARSTFESALRLEHKGRDRDLANIERDLGTFEAVLNPLVEELRAFAALP